MNSCNLGSDASAAIADSIVKSRTLKVLLLKNNKIDDEAAKVFSIALCKPG